MKYLQDRKNNKYELKGNFKLKRDYEKENQRLLLNEILSKMSDEDAVKFQSGKGTTELVKKYLPEIDVLSIQEKVNAKYINKLLVETNGITEDEANALIIELYEDYGEDQVNERFTEILSEVFTQVGKVEFKTMPTWN